MPSCSAELKPLLVTLRNLHKLPERVAVRAEGGGGWGGAVVLAGGMREKRGQGSWNESNWHG